MNMCVRLPAFVYSQRITCKTKNEQIIFATKSNIYWSIGFKWKEKQDNIKPDHGQCENNRFVHLIMATLTMAAYTRGKEKDYGKIVGCIQSVKHK